MPRKKSNEPKIGELKKELRSLRASTCRPISKMKKNEVLEELSKYRKGKPEEKVEMKVEEVEEVKAPKESKKEEAMETLNKFGKAVKSKLREKKVAKAMEGLNKFGKIVKSKLEDKKKKNKLETEIEEVKKRAEDIKLKSEAKKKSENEAFYEKEDVSDKDAKIRKDIYKCFNDKAKENIEKGLKSLKPSISLDEFIQSKRFTELINNRNATRLADIKGEQPLTPEQKKEHKLYAKLSSDNESVASASDVEEEKPKKKASKKKEEPAPAPAGKKPKFIKGSKEAKEYMASLRAKKGK